MKLLSGEIISDLRTAGDRLLSAKCQAAESCVVFREKLTVT